MLQEHRLGDAEHALGGLSVAVPALFAQPRWALGNEQDNQHGGGDRHHCGHVRDDVRGHQPAQQKGEEHAKIKHDRRHDGETATQLREVHRNAFGSVHCGGRRGQTNRQAQQHLASVKHVQTGRLHGQQHPPHK